MRSIYSAGIGEFCIFATSVFMSNLVVRYQSNPMLTDTVGFFDYCVPLTNQSGLPVPDSLKKYYDFRLFDYVTSSPKKADLVESQSLFKGHGLHIINNTEKLIQRQSQDWMLVIIIVCLALLAWIRSIYSKRLNQIFKAVAQPHHVNQLERDGNIFKERITIGLGFIYLSMSSIYIYLALRELELLPAGFHNYTLTGLIFIGLFVFYFIKSSLIYYAGLVFKTGDSAHFYQLNLLLFSLIVGITLLPLNLITIHLDNTISLYAGLLIIGLFFAYRLIRTFFTSINYKNYNLLYLFLYLCTIEILPLFLLVSIFGRNHLK